MADCFYGEWMDVEAMEALSVIRPFGALAARWRAIDRISKSRNLENSAKTRKQLAHHFIASRTGSWCR